MQEKTIAAISTAQAPGGIGIIRISGPSAIPTADRVFCSAKGNLLKNIFGYTALYGRVHDGDEDIDEAIALVFKAPASYTGEDVVELSCHGGVYITGRVLRAVLKAGAVAAQPGEFTRRAFLNGKMGLTQAEAVMDIIKAQGEQAARAARMLHEGALAKKINGIKENLLSQAAHLAAWADYPEDDIPEVHTDTLLSALKKGKSELEQLLMSYDAGKAIREGVDTVIAGRPNVGKSTLMNLLSGCERSIVTPVAGTTRDIVEETIVLGDVLLRLADTAGLRETEDPVERVGVDRARGRLRTAGLVLAVFDASQKITQEDKELLAEIGSIPSVAVINKTDLLPKIDEKYIIKHNQHIVYISALTGSGLEQLKQEVADVLGTAQLNPADGLLATERQRDAARRALEAVDEAVNAVESGLTLDAVTVSIECSIQALLELTGERVTEAVTDSVFAQFCVGK